MKKASQDELNTYKHDTFTIKIDDCDDLNNYMATASRSSRSSRTSQDISNRGSITHLSGGMFECQDCKSNRMERRNSRPQDEKCLNCAKVICDKCSILSSVSVGADSQKFCILCKACSKLEHLSIDLCDDGEKANNREFSTRLKTNNNVNRNADTVTNSNNEQKHKYKLDQANTNEQELNVSLFLSFRHSCPPSKTHGGK